MDTKSKSDRTIAWSVVAILIAIGSITYCFSIVVFILENNWSHSTQLLSQIARIIGGAIG